MPFKKAGSYAGIERRRFPRIKDKSSLILYSPGKNRVYSVEDISYGGLCFESDENILTRDNLKGEIKISDTPSKSAQTIPTWFKLIWSKKIGSKYRLGTELIQISDGDRALISKRIEEGVKKQRLYSFRKELIVHVLLIISILAGVALFIFQYRTFSSIRDSLKTALLYSEKERIRLKSSFDSIIKEREALQIDLDNTKALLVQAESMSKSERIKFNSQIEILKKDINRLENEVAGLVHKNMTLENRLHNLRELHLAIRAVKREAYLKKVKMQRKLDRIRLLYGNKGYVVKNSKSTLGTRGIIIRVLPAEIRGASNWE